MTPILADQGKAVFEGQSFTLDGDFGNTKEVRTSRILNVIPNNVVRFFKDDLYSNKIGALLFSQINNEKERFKKTRTDFAYNI